MFRKFGTIALLGFLAASASADSLFPRQVEIFGNKLNKLGEYRYVYRFFFELYEAALFTEPGANALDVLSAEVPFQLKFRYLREIDKTIILKSADRMLEKNLSEVERASIHKRVEKINEAYRTVRNGDTSSLTYKPEVGTILSINGEPVIAIEGEDFARLYFRIWLGDQAISSSLRDSLLGLK